VNNNTHYDATLMNPTLGTPAGSYSGGDESYMNSFLSNSYNTLHSAKEQYMTRCSPPKQKAEKSGSSQLAQFDPAVVILSRKWEEQQQMDLWSTHTKLLKDWRRTYERQLSLQVKAKLPTGPLTKRTKEDFVTKAGPIV
jgi:hypothetical protein